MGPAEAVILPAGNYLIGNDGIPNAGPRHARRFLTDVVIEKEIVTWQAFETFVSSGGYADTGLWRSLAGPTFPESALVESVDDRCEAVRSMTIAAAPPVWPKPRKDLPLIGLTWFEASAFCRFYGARLPFESEWEVAMSRSLLGAIRAQEWCLDGYADRYWRADSNIRGSEWRSGKKVVFRGHHLGEPALGPSSRRPIDPSSGGPIGRGFRRVWERKPNP